MMNYVVIAIYLSKLFTAVLAVMGLGCFFEMPTADGKSVGAKLFFWVGGR
jgi:hypothetical protein